MEDVRYDKIGSGYNATRKADPYLTDRIFTLLKAIPGKQYIDVGCGTGNYLTALSQRGLKFYGIDPSEIMLAQARSKENEAVFIKGVAEDLPLKNACFDGAMAILTIHHWNEIAAGFREIRRVLKPGAKFVCLSFTTAQTRQYWLNEYFPKMMERTFHITPEAEEMEMLLAGAGFRDVCFEKYFVREDLEDHFLYSSKYRPERYLIPEMRNNTSAFSHYADDQYEIAAGLVRLEEDIASGKIAEVIKRHENDEGDYLFITATA